MKYACCFILFLLLNLGLHAQAPTIESVFQQLDTITDVEARNSLLRNSLTNYPNVREVDRLRLKEQLARNYIQLQKIDSAFMVINESLLLSEQVKNDTITAKFHNIKGGAYYYLGEREEALKEFTLAVDIARGVGFTKQEAATLSNIGAIYIDQKQNDKAEKNLQKSIELHASIGKSNTSSGLLAQRLLATLYFNNGEYQKANTLLKVLVNSAKEAKNPDVQVSAQTFLAKSYAKLGNNKEAIAQFEDVLAVSRSIQNDDSEAAVLNHYSSFYEGIGNYKKALELTKQAWSLKKGIFDKQLAAATSDAEVKYQTELIQKEKEIAELEVNSKSAALELADKKQQQQWWIIFSLVIVMTSIVVIAVVVIRSRKIKDQQRLEKERIHAVLTGQERERERVAKDLHDGIVQDIAAIKHKLQLAINQDDASSNLHLLLDDLSRAGSDVRNISYQLMPLALREYGLKASIEALFERTKLIHQIDYECTFLNFENRLPETMEVTIYRVVQELIHNAVKHSHTKSLQSLFKRNENIIQINFEDNGIGFDEKEIQEGIGLNSIKSRVEMVGGTIEKDFVEEKRGTIFYIKLPL